MPAEWGDWQGGTDFVSIEARPLIQRDALATTENIHGIMKKF
jgi:hypothetical protein